MTREEAIAYGKRVIDLGLNDETQAFCELAIKALEQEPCEDFKQKAGVVIEQLRSDRDRLEKEFKELERKIRAWQRDIHDNEDDAEEFDFVFDGIYEILAEHRKGEE